MSNSCDGNCAGCASDCSTREQESLLAKPHDMSKIKHVIGVVSGKGGVGKSMVTSLLALSMRKKGYRVGILDADITGPSIPRYFGVSGRAFGNELGIVPMKSKGDVSIMSINLLLEDDTAPVVWRGPVIAGMVTQFWTDVVWGELDYLFVDLPPGTGDVPLTVFQSIALDGIVVVTSPQELVGMIVEKAVNMANLMSVPVLALAENMSYFVCRHCSEKHEIFGKSQVEETAARFSIDTTAKLPIVPALAAAADGGEIEMVSQEDLSPLSEIAEKLSRL